MDLLNKISIKQRMIFSFAFTLVLFILFAAFSIIEMNKLGELTNTLHKHPLQVSNAAIKAKAGVIRMHRSMKDVSMSKTDMELHQAIQAVQTEEKNVYQNLDIVKRQILGKEGQELVQESIELFAGWKPIRVEVEQLVLQDKREAAGRITREKGADYVFNLERQMVALTAYAINKADGFMEGAIDVQQRVLRDTIIIIGLVSLLSLLIAYFLIKSITSNLSGLESTMSEITTTGNLLKAKLTGNNEITEMAKHFNGVIDGLQSQFWLKDGQNQLSEEVTGDISYDDLATKSINFIARYVQACTGALYTYDAKRSLNELRSSYALAKGKHFSSEFVLGEGIVGQVAREKKPIHLKGITREEALVNTGTISEPPKSIYAVPLLYNNELYGILEVAAFEMLDPIKIEFVNIAADIVSIALYTVIQKNQIEELLALTQTDKEELQAQTEELHSQSEEIRQTAEELQEQNVELETQRQQVEEANRLKSEFLSNMSHELRTPLNSVMALSRVLLMQAKDKLSSEETGYLEIIERNGKNLLSLINDILDLAKIEAGKMDVSPKLFKQSSTIESILERLEPVAEDKGIELKKDIPDDLPLLESDEKRVHQILQNLIGNAVKFTSTGSVTISARSDAENLHIEVADTGIGISQTDLPHIFAEFRQVDGTTARQYEGTGLGLTIAYKAARVLGGDLSVESILGKGSKFSLTLPLRWQGITPGPEPFAPRPPAEISSPQKTVLVVDDEPEVVTMIADYLSKAGYFTLTATSGSQALELAQKHRPFAITLDVIMPDMDGFEVLQRLNEDPVTSNIPTIIISIADNKEVGFALGAVGYITKPVNKDMLISEINKIGGRSPRTIMVVDDNDFERQEISHIIAQEGMQLIATDGGIKCMQLIKKSLPDVLVLDLIMPDMDGFEVLEKLRLDPATQNLPVIVVTAKELTVEDRHKLTGNATSVLTKSDTTSRELLKEIKKILDGIEKPPKSPELMELNTAKRVLVVEDNPAAMIQIRTVLKSEGYMVDTADGGQEAIEYIKDTIPDGIILDLMMPEIDGFEVLNTIRADKTTGNIPVLILTAKDLTAKDLKELKGNNVQQLVQKGDVPREVLLHKTRLMLGETYLIEQQEKVASRKILNSPLLKTATSEGKPTILLVEDNPDNMITMKAVLHNQYNLIEATDGEQGLNMAFTKRPDLVLLDMSLPKMDGFTMVAKIKEVEETRHIPVIAMTARAMKGDRKITIEAGCDDYISKPIEPEDVLKKIEDWFRKLRDFKR